VRNYRLAKESEFFIPNRYTPSGEQQWCCYYCPLRTTCNLREWVTLDDETLQEISF
jgi:hypothetical protein